MRQIFSKDLEYVRMSILETMEIIFIFSSTNIAPSHLSLHMRNARGTRRISTHEKKEQHLDRCTVGDRAKHELPSM